MRTDRRKVAWLFLIRWQALVILCPLGLEGDKMSSHVISDKQRLILLADMGHDPDEEQQIVHLLMCSNEFELEGLITATGRFFRPNPTDSVKWLMPHLFHQLIDGYEKVYPNLQIHADGWPAPDYLRGIVANGQTGNGMRDVGEGRWSRGSRLIIESVLKPDLRPVHIVINAGANTLAQALFDYRAGHTVEEVEAFVSKLRVFENSGQDESGAWICREFPAIHWVRSVNQNRAYGGPSNSNLGPHSWQPYEYSPIGQHNWAHEHVQTNHGPLGTLYPDRRVGETTHFIEGGGTTPWMSLVSRGLTDPAEPSWGGWSGRYSVEKQLNVPSRFSIIHADETQYQPYAAYSDHSNVSERWINPRDGKVYDNVYTGSWRWRQAMWNDFRARMDWCVEPYENANHHPIAALNGDLSDRILRFSAKPGLTMMFDAAASNDPDEDALRYSWWVYSEAGPRPYGKPVAIENATEPEVEFRVPSDAGGKELHLILEVWDESSIVPLVDYRRAVISVSSRI